MRSDDLEDVLIEKLDEHFKTAVKDFVVKESTDTPFLHLTIEMTLYNYFVVRLAIEKNTLFFSIVQSGFQLQLFKTSLSSEDLRAAPSILDKEIRLRIPDKYLQAKGW
ncbi:hypothetical protein [Shewanella khirikhana]|uniref:Uncharacterized protein n=1 Tax=Shewanella khirikhana TaxID=1965282 RepID=A0ABM7DRH6_9GAMM|nr:hypothetical protein [Shewanella khirikhana]AZQ12302.1 hypothetical protein STH12_03242 [Shewanella khirikhana]